MLVLDVSGSSGNPITYIGDSSGQHTDGIGGPVISTGSNDAGATITRANAFTGNSREYRTWRGFQLVNFSGDTMDSVHSNCIVEDCIFYNANSSGAKGVEYAASVTGVTVRRCTFYGGLRGVANVGTTQVSDTAHVIENCSFFGCSRGINFDGPGGATVRNCAFFGCGVGMLTTNLAGGQTNNIYNSLVQTCTTGLSAGAAGQITEDFCAVLGNATARTNVTAGASSNTYACAMDPRTGLIETAAAALTGHSSTPDHDMFNNPRLQAGSDIGSWGPIEYPGAWTRSGTAHTGSYSWQVTGAGFKYRYVKATGANRTITIYTRFSDDTSFPYIQLIDGDGTVVATDTAAGAENTWEELSVTMPSGAAIAYRLRLVNPNTASTVLWDE